ncbi:hypothetical protein J41TS12_04730 [Paenibacillus antibioticophila]|uniref:Haem-binding uptake Tiki superfamily ChaN domain-containing protein n=1 Tax=Paenibacillus antibioticophila TaxID=1274374 RepID=A0A919XM95_9BACL|nr:hypothetical protein [Paenibacillus antibioticophila]GIO35612.1 hypothetical protein J41TS12_04730 [Paenibacillus antibioticophila]
MNDNRKIYLAKAKLLIVNCLLLALIVVLAACDSSSVSRTANKSGQPIKDTTVMTQASGHIYLYGEIHAEAKIMDKEFELWSDYYQNEGMRHLFVEHPYYTAEYLNLWMQADNDDILEAIYKDWEGTAAHTPHTKTFFKKIKKECPETIFHGTDVGHQYDSTGIRFLSYLEANDLTESEQYTLTTEAIQQGRLYYSKEDDVYRENKMTENFIREFEKLDGESIMGIYGVAHTGLDGMDYHTQSVPSMANQLQEHYGDNLSSEDLSWVFRDIEPLRVDYITLRGKKYEAAYFGKQDLTGFKDYAYREFWRLEGAYEDLKDLTLTENVLPYNNYPMLIETGQAFEIRYTKVDDTIEIEHHLSTGKVWEGMDSTQQIIVE